MQTKPGDPMNPPVSLGTVAVDLTPLRPGGDNGGAKAFSIELVRRMAALAPDVRFVLLTQAASHDELAALDGPNVRRVQVVGQAGTDARPDLLRRTSEVLAPFGAPLRRAVARGGYRVNSFMKRRGASDVLRDAGAKILFCPFTAPTFGAPGVASVCTVYDLQYRAYPQFFSVEEATLRERAFADACRNATALVAISDYSRAAAIAEGAIEPGRIRTIHLQMPRADSKGAAGVLARLALAPGRYFLYPANFWQHKNHEMLFTAFGIACREGLAADVKLACSGAPGARQAALAQSAQRLGMGGRVVFPGFLPRHELAELMSRSMGVVFPSLYEGFGLPVVEAMQCGVPVACSNVAALPEIAGDAALLFDPRVPEEIARAVLSLAHDSALRKRLIEAGGRRAREFADSARMAMQYLEVFRDAAQELHA